MVDTFTLKVVASLVIAYDFVAMFVTPSTNVRLRIIVVFASLTRTIIGSVVSGFGAIQQSAKSSRKYYTTIDLSEQKKLYNLDNADCDFLLNDCEGELIRVKEVLIKRYEKPMKEPVVDEETGEILKDKDFFVKRGLSRFACKLDHSLYDYELKVNTY